LLPYSSGREWFFLSQENGREIPDDQH